MARKVYKLSDKIDIKVDDLVITVQPLSFEVKTQIQANILNGDTMSMVHAAKEAIKNSVKEIRGLENADGSVYELEKDGDVLSDNCVNDILNIDQDSKISFICTQLLQGVSDKFIDPQSGKAIPGIKLIKDKSSPKK